VSKLRGGPFYPRSLRPASSLLALGFCAWMCSGLVPAASRDWVIHAATLLDGVSESPHRHLSILVHGDKIIRVQEGFIPAKPAELIDLSTATVMPDVAPYLIRGEDMASSIRPTRPTTHDGRGNAADLSGAADRIGSIQPGRYADLVATAEDPLQDARQWSRVAVNRRGSIPLPRRPIPLPRGSIQPSRLSISLQSDSVPQ